MRLSMAGSPFRWPLAKVSIILLAVYWCVAGFVLWQDPYEICPWGAPGILQPADNTTDDNKFLLSAVARRHDIEMVMVGSSTSMIYSPHDLAVAFPHDKVAYNLSYGGGRPLDRFYALQLIIEHSRAKHVIIWVDWSAVLPPKEAVGGFPKYLYDDSIVDKLRMVNQMSVLAAYRKARGEYIFPDFRRDLADREKVYQQVNADFHSPASMASLERLVDDHRLEVDRPGIRSCNKFPALMDQFLPQLRILARQGRDVDVVIPAFSPAFYYDIGPKDSDLRLSDQLMFRRCLVLGIQNASRVHVYGLDNDQRIVGDLMNYRDTGHLRNEKALMEALSDIGDPAMEVTTGNVDRYIEEVTQRVKRFSPAVRTIDPQAPSGRSGA